MGPGVLAVPTRGAAPEGPTAPRVAVQGQWPAVPAGHLAIRTPSLDADAVRRLWTDAGTALEEALGLRELSGVRSVSACADAAVVTAALVDLRDRCRRRALPFTVEFTLDDDADACAALGRPATTLRPILDQSRALRVKGVGVRWRVPLLPPLVYRLEALFSLARDEGIDPVLVPPAAPREDLTADQRRFAADFIADRLLDEERRLLPPDRAGLYEAMLDVLEHRLAHLPRAVPRTAVMHAGAAGQPWTLTREGWPAGGDASPAAGAQGRGAAAARTERGGSGAAEVAGVLAEGGRAVLAWGTTQLLRVLGTTPARTMPDRLPRVLVIGAYGGDHIGDAAILGGVLLRMHRRYGTSAAILVSQRPAHSARLAAMLDTPVAVSVEEYRQATVPALLAQVDGVVFAGGPLMDLPKQLVKHLYAVSLARRAGKPFIVEGVGAGPFVRRVSAWTGRRLVRMAERVAVRTADDARAPLVTGLQVEVGRDPAFDYLETRSAGLTRLPEAERRSLEQLLAGVDGRVVIGVNLRPLRPDYTTGAGAGSRAEYTRFVESRFEERLAEAMRRLHKASRSAPCFVFFPMNSIQFGSSDLRSAYRVRRLLGSDVDFRIWEADPSIDGVIALLRRLDVAITMRFHATIYALAQQRQVIGIDYRPGRRDKVAALLDDAGLSANCRRIDDMTTEWLCERVTALAPALAAVTAAPRPGGTAGSTLLQVRRPGPR